MSTDSPATPAAQIFTPPNPIRMKVSKKLGTADTMIQAAETAITEMAGEYEQWLSEDLQRLRERCETLRTVEAGARAEHLSAAARQVHDIKGQGTSFGYQLITKIAASLHRYLYGTPADQLRNPVIFAHVQALEAVATMKVRGDGGEVGRLIVDTLAKAIGDPRSAR
jgi:chemotaxis protein histidine kinase CheA